MSNQILSENSVNVLDEYGNDILDETGSSTKNATRWIPANRFGTVVQTGNSFSVCNLGYFLVDNSGNFLVTTPPNLTGAFATAWTPTPAS